MREHIKPCPFVAEYFKLFGRDIQSGQQVRQMCKLDAGVAIRFARQGSRLSDVKLQPKVPARATGCRKVAESKIRREVLRFS